MRHNYKVSIPLAIVITLIAVIYQRSTGPTYPKKVYLELGQAEKVKVKFPRSHGGETGAPVEIPKVGSAISGKLFYKRYPTEDAWTSVELEDKGNRLYAELPNQPPAGKLTYYLELTTAKGKQKIGSLEDPIYIRFKGHVPTFILAPHIVFMFLSMLLSVVALFESVFKTESYKKIGKITLGCLVVGGLMLGPMVQNYAFGVYWAGFPYDWDLTDNKLLIGVLSWGAAVLLSMKNTRRWPTIIAAVVLFAVYSIPHSMQGSEYDYKKGTVEIDVD
jgi:hypothetical protein